MKDNEPALRSALITVMSDAALRRRLGERNRDHARVHYGLAMMVERYNGLFREQITGSAAGRRDPRAAASPT